MIIAAPRLFREGQLTGPGAVVVDRAVIAAVLDHVPDDADIVLDQGVLAPGLIDIHLNGAFGIDCATAGTDGFGALCAGLAARGVTSFAPTIITAPIEDVHAGAARVRAARDALAAAPVAQILGLHLEGPFLSPIRRGAHRADWLLVPDDAVLDRLLADADLRAVLRIVTLAPELPNAMAAIRRLVVLGVKVALGHSDADAPTARRAVAAGATIATHVFTAMRPFHHRDPGLVGVALADPGLAACFIADAIHADPITLKSGFAAAGERAVAVTDAVALAGLGEGAAGDFGGAGARVEHGAARRADGTLTGAIITLDEGVRRLIAAGVPVEAALFAATAAPAWAMGLTDRGRLAAGQRADLVWFDDGYEVRNSWVGGVPLRDCPPPPIRPRSLPLTETVRTDLADLDLQPSPAIIRALLAQEARAQMALATQADALAALADAIAEKLRAGGRLFYAGAGTSGRLAALDAVECGPTFSLPPGVIIALTAGGDAAIIGAVEGAEDDRHAAAAIVARYKVGPADALVGIAASGATPFTLASIEAARAAGALTASVTNSPGPMAQAAAHAIVIRSGPEVLAGSTRLSAGTTQKIALNALSTTIMIRLGKSYGPYMVDLKASNRKLRDRATRMVAAISECDAATAARALALCDYQVKLAVVMIGRGLDAQDARSLLDDAGQNLRVALRKV